MRKFAAFLILIALFVVLVGSRFEASDGDKLASIAKIAGLKLRNALPQTVNLTNPIEALRKELPTRPEDAVRSRLTADKRLIGVNVTVTVEGTALKLRGVVPDIKTRKIVVGLAENTVGIEQVVDELAMPE
jgi:hyperosmotically inducible protein